MPCWGVCVWWPAEISAGEWDKGTPVSSTFSWAFTPNPCSSLLTKAKENSNVPKPTFSHVSFPLRREVTHTCYPPFPTHPLSNLLKYRFCSHEQALCDTLIIFPSIYWRHWVLRASQVALVVKNLPVNAGEIRHEFNPMGWEDPMEEGLATHDYILAWESHGQRSLAGYSP